MLRSLNLWPISSQTISDLVLHLLNGNCLESPLLCLANFYWSFETYVNHLVNILNSPCRREPNCTNPPALALIIPLLALFLERKHIHKLLLPNYKTLERTVLCFSTFMFFSPMRNYWSHLRNHFYLPVCFLCKNQSFLFLNGSGNVSLKVQLWPVCRDSVLLYSSENYWFFSC